MDAFERLADRVASVDSLVCVGLDPDPDRLPPAVQGAENPRLAFNRRIVDATHEYAAAYKPNAAFYEDPAGWHALAGTVEAAHGHDVPLVLDAKRGDVGHTAARYADLLADTGADAITVSPYLGRDGIEPFLEHGAAFVLCRTSNPGGADLQECALAGGDLLYELVADLVAGLDGEAGLVVGATAPAELRAIRERVPGLPFLVPGVGAQSGDAVAAAECAPAAEGPFAGAGVVNSSRGIIFAGEAEGATGDDFFRAAGEAARDLRDRLRTGASG
ncbi:MAG: orotidine-5'-phosphate decarboxylase [Halobacteriaceae archaeon]